MVRCRACGKHTEFLLFDETPVCDPPCQDLLRCLGLRWYDHLEYQRTSVECLRACVATVLGMPLDQVPNSFSHPTWDSRKQGEWLASKGLQLIDFVFGTVSLPQVPIPCILTGRSRITPKHLHACVGYADATGIYATHDPLGTTHKFFDGEPTHVTFFVQLSVDVQYYRMLYRALLSSDKKPVLKYLEGRL